MPGGTSKTLAEVVRRGVERGAADLHVAIPAVVTKVDRDRGLVDAKPSLRDFFDDGDDLRTVDVAVVCNVPIHYPGAGAFRLTFPVVVGDECLLLFADRSLDVWLSKGGEVDPSPGIRHAISDAVALFGVHSIPKAWRNVAGDGMTIGHDGSGPRAKFTASEISLDGGTKKVARAGDACTFTLNDGEGRPCTGTIQIDPDAGAGRVKA
jgi:hypothetical protein